MELDKVLPLSSDTNGFDNIFVSLAHDYSLELPNENKLEIFHLRKSNKLFSHSELVEFCVGNISQYVFSRMINQAATTQSQIQILARNAVKKFREISKDEGSKDSGEGGELGELLLYLFLEERLKAPKILSKVEIKTTRNQYVYGADGVHLYQTLTKKGKPNFQFILGESKIKNNILDAVRVAFTSLENTINKVDVEKGLVSLEIFKEVCDKDNANLLKELILPTEDISERTTQHENAFGIFIGYTVGVENDKMLSNEEWNEAVDIKILDDINRALSTIKRQIDSKNLSGYSFYIYFMPFNKADEDRAKIISEIIG